MAMTTERARELAELTIKTRVSEIGWHDTVDVVLDEVQSATGEEIAAVAKLVAAAQITVTFPEVGE